MKGILSFIMLSLLVPVFSFANPERNGENRSARASFGFSLQDWNQDFGMGISITSPWFLYQKASIKLSGNVLFKEDNQWEPYYAVRLGCIGGSFMESADIRLYGEGGVLFLFPTQTFDSSSFRFGGYGHFGFEFFLSTKKWASSYFIELGSNGINATTNTGNSYVNGFSAACGFRIYP